ncbi:MAG TPA: translocation/assembly module TamB domain-containing protein [Terriglobales bacterium]|nr:translocation/assembly module TamB domain-containing protein [Terriglobales bacterium]
MLLEDANPPREETPPPRSRKRAVILAAIFLIVVLGAAWYLRSDRFLQVVRSRVVDELERVTGGRVELKRFTWNLSQLEFVAEDLTIHGLEPPDVAPYAHIDYLKVRVKILSVFQREIGLRFVGAARPMLHIIVNPDGTTNQPVPKIKREGKGSPLDVLFQLAIDRLEMAQGELLWNDYKIPLDLKAEKVSAEMTYDLAARRYDGRLSVGGSLFTYGNYRPLTSNAELQIGLVRNEAEIKSFRWASPGSQMEASGRIRNLDDPEIDLAYTATLSATELGSTARVTALRAGTVDMKGTAKVSAGKYATQGQLHLKGLTWRDEDLAITNVSGTSHYALNPTTVDLTGIAVQAMGGLIRGKVHVANWANTKPGAEKEIQRGEAALTLSGMQMRSLAAAASSKQMPLDKLKATGIANGTLNARWVGTPANANAVIALDVAPPTNPAADAMPVNARLRGEYIGAQKVLHLAELNLATRSTRLQGSGTLGTDTGRLTLKAETTDLGEFDPLLSTPSAKFPIVLEGRATFDGTVSGRFEQPNVRGRLEIAGFESTVTVPSSSIAPVTTAAAPANPAPANTKKIHWDALGVDLDYSPQQIVVQNGTLRRGTAQINFSGRSSLRKGAFDKDNSVFNAKVDLRNATLPDVQSLAGTNYPVTGTVNGAVEVSGTMKTLAGQGHVQLAAGEIYGEPYKSLTSDIRFRGQDVELRNVNLAQNGARMNGNVAYNLTTKFFRFDAKAVNVDLSHVQRLKTMRATMGGIASLEASGSGTIEAPVVNAKLAIREMSVNGQVAGDFNADAVTHGRQLDIKARSNFQNADLTADGTVDLRGDFPAKIAARFNNFTVDPFLRAYMSSSTVDAKTSMSGTVDVAGPLKTPKLLRVEAKVDQLFAEVEKIKLTNAGPLSFLMEDQVVHVRQFHITGDGTDLTAEGTAQLTGNRALNLRANGVANLKLFQGFSPGLMSYGLTTLNMTVAGTMAKPAMSGQVEIKEAGVSFLDLPNGLSGINGTLVFNQDRLQVQMLTAKTGGGQLEIAGFIAYRNGLFFNLSATGQEIRLRYPPGISTSVNADLRYIGSAASSVLSGDILVTRFGVNPRFDFALYLARSKQPPTAPRANPFMDNLRLDVHVISTPELRVETSLAKISGDADLRLRGTASRPAVLGRVNVVEGEIFFSGTKYKLERGDVTFTNPVRIEPVLNMEASARVREYDITLGFHGSTDKLSTTYRSEPPLPSADIIALLALGRTREEAVITQQQSNQSFTETASNAILGQALNAAVSSRVEKLFGVSRIKIDPQVGGPENANARVTIEQQVNNNVTLTYITNLSQSAQQVIQVEFNVTRDVSIVAVRDQNGVLGFDVRVRQRKK